jgi:hypothetical protein
VITAVALEVAAVEPALFVAVTITRTVWPPMPELTGYDELVAPEISTQLAPALSQRSQR